jgi:hypothetical protein
MRVHVMFLNVNTEVRMQRTTLIVNNTSYPLAQGQDTDTIEAAAVEAVHEGGGMITATAYGNREVSILVSEGVPLVFESQEVPSESRDDGNLGSPFDPYSEFDDIIPKD